TALSYVWTKDGSPVSGGTSATLRLLSAASGTYTVTVTNEVGSVTRSATLTLSSNPDDVTVHHAGSTSGATDTRGNFYSKWWVYTVDLSNSEGLDQGAGYWLLERTLQSGTVTPGSSAWIIKPTVLSGTLRSDIWTAARQTVQDSADSITKVDFSVVAYRTAAESGGATDASFNIGGKVETAGTAAYYGAPDFMAGDYAEGDVEMSWDAEQVDILQLVSSFDDAVESLMQYLERPAAAAPGE
ncbi:MAG: hypothetical protein EBS01_07360, partial [Verrucomicrobia bacterium]|nr:hypothetical protein [Verrucomicrobiota bacterium]